MSDFLTRLIEKNDRPAPFIRPRPVSLYEPRQEIGAAPDPFDLPPAENAPVPEERPARADPLAGRLPAMELPAVAASGVSAPLAEPQPAPAQANYHLPSAVQVDATLVAPGASSPPAEHPSRPAPAASENALDGARLRAAEPPHSIHPGGENPLTANAWPAGQRAEPRLADPPAHPAGSDMAIHRALPATPSKSLAADRAENAVPIRPALPAQALNPGPQSAESAPVVEVTIGRIEVRAEAPPNPPARERAGEATRQPGLTLDEYLRQRNGGRK
jgi:hypothetical protein